MSKKTVFTAEQNAALRAVLVKLEASRSHTELGRELDIAQQNVTRLIRDERSGFAYATASRLVRLVGFVGVDAFFADRDVALPSAPDSETSLVHDQAPAQTG